jgi:hypothetical protein
MGDRELMPTFAVAYLWVDFPKFDTVQQIGTERVYFLKGKEVYREKVNFEQLSRTPMLTLTAITAGTREEAEKKIIETFDCHIISIVSIVSMKAEK